LSTRPRTRTGLRATRRSRRRCFVYQKIE
jgi:hypothetical protein